MHSSWNDYSNMFNKDTDKEWVSILFIHYACMHSSISPRIILFGVFFLDYFNPDSIRGARTNLSQSIIYICYEGELIFHIFMNIEHWTMNNGALALLCCIELKFVRLRAQTGGYIKLYTIPLRGRTIFYLYFIGLCVCECTCGTVQWKLLTVKVLAIQIRI